MYLLRAVAPGTLDYDSVALYAATNAITRAYRDPLGKLGLTYLQYPVMVVLCEQGAHSVSGLAVALQLDPSTLTPLLKRLELAGWITRTGDDADERVVRIGLTDAGQQLRRPVAAIHKGVASRTRLSVAEFVDLRDRLHALVDTAADADVAGTATP